MKRKVGLLFDSVSRNTGDMAMGIVFEQQFAADKLIETVVVNPFTTNLYQYDVVIIGGGQLLRQTGDAYYDQFRRQGPYILNSIGILPPINDLEYLNQYKFVAARTSREADVLKKVVPTTQQMPCMTTLLKGKNYTIPGVKKGKKLIGVHLVPASLQQCPDIVEQINALPYTKVLIPFTHYHNDRSFMQSLPFDWDNCLLIDELSPEELHNVIGQMHYNVVSSLHATIFSYAQNVPFASLGQAKTIDYLADRHLEGYTYTSSQSLRKVLETLEQSPPDMHQQVQKDTQELQKILTHYRQIIQHSAASTKRLPQDVSGELQAKTVQLRIANEVITGRDRLIADMVKHQRYLEDTITQREAELAHTERLLSEANSQNQALLSSREYKIGWHVVHPKGSARSLRRKSKRYLQDKAIQQTSSRRIIQQYFLSHPAEIKKTSDLAVVIHVYYPDMWPQIVRYLQRLDKAKLLYDLHITITADNQELQSSLLRQYPAAHVYTVPNKGRDILPFVAVAKILLDNNYVSVLKLHTKKSLHWEGGEQWFRATCNDLLPIRRQALRKIVATLEQPQTGVIGAASYYYPLTVNFEANGSHMTKLLRRIYSYRTARRCLQTERQNYGFFAGSMFWARLDAVKGTIDKAITSRYETEAGQVDGTVAHAVERLFCLEPELEGRAIYQLTKGDLTPRDYQSSQLPEWHIDH